MKSYLSLPMPIKPPTPQDVASYLIQHGWRFLRVQGDWALYSRELNGRSFTVEVPQLFEAPDYLRSLGFLLNDLARLYELSLTQLYQEIISASLDVVRLSIEGSSMEGGRISVSAGARVYESARELLMAAGCAALHLRASYGNRKPEEVLRLMERARFAPSEVGSFVLRVELPVGPALQGALPWVSIDPEPPLERKASIQLALALEAALNASKTALASRTIAPFEAGIKSGVSAQLCDAVASILEVGGVDYVSANFAFTTQRPVPADVPKDIRFHQKHAEILRAAAQELRPVIRQDSTVLTGKVIKLNSIDLASGGEILLKPDIEKAPRAVKIRLSSEAYRRAIEAHLGQKSMTFEGRLVKQGGGWIFEQDNE